MTQRNLSILAAAVTLALAASAGAQVPTDVPPPEPVVTPPVTTPPDTIPPVGTLTDPMNRTTTRPTTLRQQPQTTTATELDQDAEQVARQEHVFDQLDASGDGYLARTDLPAESPLHQQFDQWDTDNDGRLSRIEFSTWAAHQSSEAVAALADEPRDELDYDDFTPGATPPGSQAGAPTEAAAAQSGTAGTTAGELAGSSLQQQPPQRSEGTASTADAAGITGDQQPQETEFARNQQVFDHLDSSGDGFLTRNDLPPDAGLQREFEVWDTDNDGRLSRLEFDAWARQQTGDELATLGEDAGFDDAGGAAGTPGAAADTAAADTLGRTTGTPASPTPATQAAQVTDARSDASDVTDETRRAERERLVDDQDDRADVWDGDPTTDTTAQQTRDAATPAMQRDRPWMHDADPQHGSTGGRGTAAATTAATTGTVGTADTMVGADVAAEVEPMRREYRSFNELDSNNDGFVYRSDVMVGTDLEANFDQYDLDRDGRLTRSEHDAWLAARGAERDAFDATAEQDVDPEEEYR